MQQFGYSVEYVIGTKEQQPSFAYTIGLFAHGYPELLVFGFGAQAAWKVLNGMSGLILAGTEMSPGSDRLRQHDGHNSGGPPTVGVSEFGPVSRHHLGQLAEVRHSLLLGVPAGQTVGLQGLGGIFQAVPRLGQQVGLLAAGAAQCTAEAGDVRVDRRGGGDRSTTRHGYKYGDTRTGQRPGCY
jgi:hypothetical protein